MAWKPEWKAFDKVVSRIVDEYTMVFGVDTSLDTDDDVLKHSKLFIRDALTFWVFSDAIRYEDIGTMWLVYTFWLFMFRGASCHNYGNEILEMVAQYTYEMGELLRQVTERTWLVNRWGKLGRAIPTDRYMENNNGFIKVRLIADSTKDVNRIPQNLFAASPACASISYIQEKGSGPVELLRKLSRDVATYFNITDINRRHSEVNKEADIRALVIDLKDSNVHTLVPGQTIMPVGPNKGRGATDIFTEGKEVLEHGAFRNWKDRTGKLGADVFGCDPEYQHQHEEVVGRRGDDGGGDAGGRGGDGDGQGGDGDGQGGDGDGQVGGGDGLGVLVEFDALADPEIADEI